MIFRAPTQAKYGFSERFFMPYRNYSMMKNIVNKTSGGNDTKSRSRQQAYYALTLIKRLGKHSGYTAQMINLLDYYLSFTKDLDWEGKGAPIIYQSLCRTAFDLGLSVRQIQRIEKRLADKSLLRFEDSPNNKRYGTRDASGRITKAFGVDLSPLTDSIAMLECAEKHRRAQKQAWLSLKHSVHQLRKEIRSFILSDTSTFDDETAQAIDAPIRPNVTATKLQSIISLLTKLLNKLCKQGEKNFANVDKNVVHKENTKISNISNNKTAPNNLGLENITYQDLSRYIYRNHKDIKLSNWQDIMQYAEDHRHLYGISDDIWRKSDALIGKVASAIAFMVTSHGFNREKSKIYNPKAYFSALLQRAEQGALFLDKAIY